MLEEARHEPPPSKPMLDPNDDKPLDREVRGARWARVPIQTDLFARGDDLTDQVTSYVTTVVRHAVEDERLAPGFEDTWYVLVSEKIVAITQGRSYFTWEIKPSRMARLLARYVARTPHGIGLGDPHTMQLAINEAGLPRILVAAAASVLGKLVGRKGVFYQVAGHRVNAIDGPTSYSAYPSNVSAKLPPEDPDKVAASLTTALRERLPGHLAGSLGGTVVIDSNDLGRDVLGKDTPTDDEFFCELFADNPFGQGRQQTPIAIGVRLGNSETAR